MRAPGCFVLTLTFDVMAVLESAALSSWMEPELSDD
jgi:hypothetical protein